MPTRPFLQQTNEEIKKTFDINVMAHFWVRTSSNIKFLNKNVP